MKAYLRKICSLTLSLLLVFCVIPFAAFAAETVASGSCGEYLSWTLDPDGLLTIGGTGKMFSYSSTGSVTRAPLRSQTV